MNATQARGALVDAAASRGVSLAALSVAIGRNRAYIQQYVTRGSPRVLTARDRQLLASMLAVDADVLGPTKELSCVACSCELCDASDREDAIDALAAALYEGRVARGMIRSWKNASAFSKRRFRQMAEAADAHLHPAK